MQIDIIRKCSRVLHVHSSVGWHGEPHIVIAVAPVIGVVGMCVYILFKFPAIFFSVELNDRRYIMWLTVSCLHDNKEQDFLCGARNSAWKGVAEGLGTS